MKSLRSINFLLVMSLFSILKSAAQNSNDMVNKKYFEGFTFLTENSSTGNVEYYEEDQKIKISTSSSSFLYKKIDDNFMLQSNIEATTQPHNLSGLMLKSDLNGNENWLTCLKENEHVIIEWKNNNQEIQYKKIDIKADVFRIERIDNTYIVSLAEFGKEFVNHIIEFKSTNILHAGLTLVSNDDQNVFSIFKNTRIFNTKNTEVKEYKDYLGSYLEVLNVENGDRKILDEAKGSWQAPNWTPDGKTLIYNADGLLYNFDLASKKSEVLNTGFANRNNNDHVLSFDGKQMGISHHSLEDDGQSIIYTLPIEGGTPKKITDKSPSYLHGWSPDNQHLIYTASRNGQYDIYKISSNGGEEIQLTNQKMLDDGSEYSPDGKYIYFNSARTGTMQIWRMKPDGSEQIQLTFDQLNDWFPHISPDNKWMLFLSYGKEVDAGDHPFYKNVYLRIMPIEGGQPKVVAYLYGGQGSINVPSWNPESNKVAFISNGNNN